MAFRRTTSSGFEDLTTYLRREGVKSFADTGHGTPVYEVYSLSNCGGMIEAGVAVIPVPIGLYQRELHEGRLAIVKVRAHPPSLRAYGCCRTNTEAVDMDDIPQIARECSTGFCAERET